MKSGDNERTNQGTTRNHGQGKAESRRRLFLGDGGGGGSCVLESFSHFFRLFSRIHRDSQRRKWVARRGLDCPSREEHNERRPLAELNWTAGLDQIWKMGKSLSAWINGPPWWRPIALRNCSSFRIEGFSERIEHSWKVFSYMVGYYLAPKSGQLI